MCTFTVLFALYIESVIINANFSYSNRQEMSNKLKI